MCSSDQLRPKRSVNAGFQVREKRDRDRRFNRDLYFAVGEMWSWIDKRPWTDEQWQEYALEPGLRTYAAYYDNTVAGYYELRRDHEDGVEIRILRVVTGICWLRFWRRVTYQRDRTSLANVAVAGLGAYLQSRSPAGIGQLSGERDENLQGRRKVGSRRNVNAGGFLISFRRQRSAGGGVLASCIHCERGHRRETKQN